MEVVNSDTNHLSNSSFNKPDSTTAEKKASVHENQVIVPVVIHSLQNDFSRFAVLFIGPMMAATFVAEVEDGGRSGTKNEARLLIGKHFDLRVTFMQIVVNAMYEKKVCLLLRRWL